MPLASYCALKAQRAVGIRMSGTLTYGQFRVAYEFIGRQVQIGRGWSLPDAAARS